MRLLLLIIALALAGCPTNSDCTDADLDGACQANDCDDNDDNTFPEAAEACDGLDNDCDGDIPQDELDTDGDGWLACEDCNDGNHGLHEWTSEGDCI